MKKFHPVTTLTHSSPQPSRRDIEVMYRTMSICPKCVIGERRGVSWVPARVVRDDSSVYLIASCTRHGAHRTLYCSDVGFFNRVMRSSDDVHSLNPALGSDVDDVDARSSSDEDGEIADLMVNHGTFSDETVKLDQSHMSSPSPGSPG